MKGPVKTFVVGFLLGLTIHYLPNYNNAPTISFGLKEQPSLHSQYIVEREGYTLSYDGRTKIANFVFEEISKGSLQGDVDRTDHQFSSDPDLPPILRSTPSDYKNSGFDCGHLAPAADFKKNKVAMAQSFLLSNISPQKPEFNRGYWKRFENYVRELANRYDRLEVVTGPLFLSHEKKNGKKYVTYEVIGRNEVAVPTHFFKVITVRGLIQKRWAYIIPNKYIEESTPFETFKVALETIERASGIVFDREKN